MSTHNIPDIPLNMDALFWMTFFIFNTYFTANLINTIHGIDKVMISLFFLMYIKINAPLLRGNGFINVYL